jgi:hypothetical protein
MAKVWRLRNLVIFNVVRFQDEQDSSKVREGRLWLFDRHLLTKPLAKGRLLNVKGRQIWVSFQYERFPRLCFSCGVTKHGSGGYSMECG